MIEYVDILKINASDFKADAIRPSYSVLDCRDTENFLNLKQQDWEVELKKVMAKLKDGTFENILNMSL